MPKETFYNLDADKKNKILDAAKREFTNYELHKCRVSNIIKAADIPRGSFYQYFEDLDDLYYYVIDDVFESIFEEGIHYAKETTDVFEFTERTFLVDYDNYHNDKRHRFIMNVLKSIGSNNEYLIHHHQKRKDYILLVLQHMDVSTLRLDTEDDKIRFYELLQSMKRMIINRSMMKQSTKKEAVEQLRWHLDIIRNGIKKQEIIQ